MQSPYHYFVQQLLQSANQDYALAMSAYMKNHFEFYGINAPMRKQIVKDARSKLVISDPNQAFWELMQQLWNDDHRECQYIAIDLMQKCSKKIGIDSLPFLEKLIVTKSWWDTVDGIAPALIGELFRRYPEQRNSYIYRWIDSDNIWLQRSAIIFQLKYGKNTDWDLLSEAILKHDTSKEFFVRKAQGWALRQYSKFEPMKVIAFVEANPQLSGLTKKEALRNLK
ncbi:MAG: DNA alkylation repair protein [Saprospiraceae bacterium]|nr:DNA alkylation repair protein [Saprospiraceae bacterium]